MSPHPTHITAHVPMRAVTSCAADRAVGVIPIPFHAGLKAAGRATCGIRASRVNAYGSNPTRVLVTVDSKYIEKAFTRDDELIAISKVERFYESAGTNCVIIQMRLVMHSRITTRPTRKIKLSGTAHYIGRRPVTRLPSQCITSCDTFLAGSRLPSIFSGDFVTRVNAVYRAQAFGGASCRQQWKHCTSTKLPRQSAASRLCPRRSTVVKTLFSNSQVATRRRWIVHDPPGDRCPIKQGCVRSCRLS